MQGAVLAVSMQHILLRFGGDAVDSVKAYNATIQGLIARSYHCPPDQDISCRVVLLLLHLREVMSGSNDFKFLYGSLRALQNTATTSITRGSIGFSHQLAEYVDIQTLRYWVTDHIDSTVMLSSITLQGPPIR